MPSIMKREDWDLYITTIVSKAIKVKSEFEMTPEGEFRNILTRYISNQANALDIDDILNGQCFVDDEESRVYFRLDQLQEYMRNRRYGALTSNQMGIFLRNLGGDYSKRKLNNKKGQLVWWIPSDKIITKQEVEIQQDKEEEIPF